MIRIQDHEKGASKFLLNSTRNLYYTDFFESLNEPNLILCWYHTFWSEKVASHHNHVHRKRPASFYSSKNNWSCMKSSLEKEDKGNNEPVSVLTIKATVEIERKVGDFFSKWKTTIIMIVSLILKVYLASCRVSHSAIQQYDARAFLFIFIVVITSMISLDVTWWYEMRMRSEMCVYFF